MHSSINPSHTDSMPAAALTHRTFQLDSRSIGDRKLAAHTSRQNFTTTLAPCSHRCFRIDHAPISRMGAENEKTNHALKTMFQRSLPQTGPITCWPGRGHGFGHTSRITQRTPKTEHRRTLRIREIVEVKETLFTSLLFDSVTGMSKTEMESFVLFSSLHCWQPSLAVSSVTQGKYRT